MAEERRQVPSGAPWEAQVGYSRAVRAGDLVFVAGTTAIADGRPVCPRTAYEQASAALDIIAQALDRSGAELADVVRTRIYVKNMRDWPEVARAHRERFRDVRPAATLVEVAGLVEPELLVEIEADAVVRRG